MTSNYLTSPVGCVALSVLVIFNWRTPTLHDALLMGALGGMAMLGHLLLTNAFRFASAATLAPFTYQPDRVRRGGGLPRLRSRTGCRRPARHGGDHRQRAVHGLCAAPPARSRRINGKCAIRMAEQLLSIDIEMNRQGDSTLACNAYNKRSLYAATLSS